MTTGFSTLDTVISSAVAGKMQRLGFSKLAATAGVALTPRTTWKDTGTPAAGADPTLGVGNGASPTNRTGGGWPYNGSATGTQNALIGIGAASGTASSTGTLILCDRQAHIQLSVAQATSALTGMDGTGRMAATTAPGDGGMLWAECTAAMSAAQNTFTFTYTNMLGTGSEVTPNVLNGSSTAVGNMAFQTTGVVTYLWTILATGDTGVRSVQTVTLVTNNSATGQYDLCIVRPLAYLPIAAVSQYLERDLVIEIPGTQKLYDSSCLFMIYLPAAANTPTIYGEARVCGG